MTHTGRGHQGSTLHDYVSVVRRRKWIILQTALIIPLAAVALSLQQGSLYQASADVLLNRQNLAASLDGVTDPTSYQQPERLVQTQAGLARVPAVAERVLRAVRPANMTVQDFLDASAVQTRPDADLLAFQVRSEDPKLAARLATEYARQYTTYRRQLDTSALERARTQVAGRIARLDAAGDRQSALYASLVEKEEQLRTMEALQTSPVLVRPADESTQVQPRPFRNAFFGLALGLVLGIGLAFLWEALDTRLRSADEIGERLGLPLLARLPEPPREFRNENRLAMLVEPGGIHSEAVRMLRTNFEFVNLERRARTIMVTSALPSEGKSTTAANLSIALARAGRRVVLVDLDLRRPILDRFFSINGAPGLTDVALAHADLTQALTPVALTRSDGPVADVSGNGHARVEGNLEIVSAGPLPPDPGEFVGGGAIAGILEELKERADVVIIDAPPLLNVGDAMTLSAKVDALLVVTRLNTIRRPILNELQRLLESSPATSLGFILTGADLEEGYGYGYGSYSYGSSERDPRERVA